MIRKIILSVVEVISLKIETLFSLIKIGQKGYSGLNKSEREPMIIVSLTTIPSRIKYLHYTLANIFNQTLLPDKIILYVAKEEFERETIPKHILELEKKGLEIQFVDNLRSHKKYFYAMQAYPNALIITIDDDILYRKTIVEALYNSYIENPTCISCMRVNKIKRDIDGKVLPYSKWDMNVKNEQASSDLLAVGAGGILYPPHLLSQKVFDIEELLKRSIYADDIWLKGAQLANGIKVKMASCSHLYEIHLANRKQQKEALSHENVKHRNDECIALVSEWFDVRF